jgi:multicomponent Na+:H+ antiporter subunit B
MNSVILQLAYRYIRFIFFVFAFIILMRGHNYPGGGFIGGLLAALAIVYKGFAYSLESVGSQTERSAQWLLGMGLSAIFMSFIPSLITGKSFMTGHWIRLPFPGDIKLGTPLLFDVGVFLAVAGVTLLFLISLSKSEAWK